MASEIDNLIIRIKADTSQLQSELKQIEGKIKISGAAGGAAFGGMAASLKKVKGPAVAAAVAIAAIVLPMKMIAGVGSQFEDLKDSLDQVFGSMKAGDKAMEQVFQFAQTTPFQIEDATKAFIALKSAGIEPNMEMLQTFADAASTSIDQLGAFEAMVRIVQRSAAGGMGLEEINQLDDRGIPATKILTEALGKTREELSVFGKTAEGAATMIKILTDGLQEKFGGAMANKMDNLSTKTSNMVIAFKQLADEIFKSGLGDFLKGLVDRLSALAQSIGKVVRAMGGRQTTTDVTGTSNPVEQAKILNAMILEEDKKLATARQKIQEGFGGVFHKNVRDALAKSMDLNLRLDDLTVDATAVKVTNLSTLDEGDINFMSEFRKLVVDAQPELEKLDETIAKVVAMKGKLNEKGELVASDQEFERVLAQLGVVRAELLKTDEVTGALALVLESAVDTFSTDFVSALMEGEDAMQSFKEMTKQMVAQVIAEFLKMQIIKPMMNALFAAVGLPSLPAAAGGGTIQGGQATLVGERGPEIFMPNTGGTVMNNMNSKNAMGGGGTIINQSINFAVGVVPTVRAEVMKMLPQISDVTKNAVATSAMRNGTYRRMLQGG